MLIWHGIQLGVAVRARPSEEKVASVLAEMGRVLAKHLGERN